MATVEGSVIEEARFDSSSDESIKEVRISIIKGSPLDSISKGDSLSFLS